MTEGEGTIKGAIESVCNDASNKLAELGVVAAQFIVLYDDAGKCYSWEQGIGNWYARVGACGEFLTKNDERVRQFIKQEDPEE